MGQPAVNVYFGEKLHALLRVRELHLVYDFARKSLSCMEVDNVKHFRESAGSEQRPASVLSNQPIRVWIAVFDHMVTVVCVLNLTNLVAWCS